MVTRWFPNVSKPLQAIKFRRCLKESTAAIAACYPNSTCSWSWSKDVQSSCSTRPLKKAPAWIPFCAHLSRSQSRNDATHTTTFWSKVVSLAPSQQLCQRNVIGFIWLHNWTSFGFGTLIVQMDQHGCCSGCLCHVCRANIPRHTYDTNISQPTHWASLLLSISIYCNVWVVLPVEWTWWHVCCIVSKCSLTGCLYLCWSSCVCLLSWLQCSTRTLWNHKVILVELDTLLSTRAKAAN